MLAHAQQRDRPPPSPAGLGVRLQHHSPTPSSRLPHPTREPRPLPFPPSAKGGSVTKVVDQFSSLTPGHRAGYARGALLIRPRSVQHVCCARRTTYVEPRTF